MNSLTNFVAKGETFQLPSRYTPGRMMGSGAFGVVISVTDEVTGEEFAVKKLVNAFECAGDSKRFLREVCLMRHFEHENIVSLHDMFVPNLVNNDEFDDVYLVSKLMPCNLKSVLRERPALTNEHFQHLMYQLLSGLHYMHSAGVVHRDIKPSNILVDGACGLKICDFGLSRRVNEEDLHMTQYVCTRWYRAPEVMLDFACYDSAIDMWSAGCVFAELLSFKPLFECADYMSMLRLILRVVGTPSESDLQFITNPRARRFVRSQPITHGIDFAVLFPAASPQARDLLRRLLTFNPHKRITAAEALCHPFFAGVHDERAPLPVCSRPFHFPYDSQDLSPDSLRVLMAQQLTQVQRSQGGDQQQQQRAQSAFFDADGHRTAAAGAPPATSVASSVEPKCAPHAPSTPLCTPSLLAGGKSWGGCATPVAPPATLHAAQHVADILLECHTPSSRATVARGDFAC